MTYNPHVNHRRSIRLRGYDYAQAGAYFVTVCTHRRELVFDDPSLRTMIQRIWEMVAGGRCDDIDDYVVMPNHIHGVVWIDRASAVGARHSVDLPSPKLHRAARTGLRFDASLWVPRPYTPRLPHAPLSGSLGAIVGTFKSASTRRVNRARRTTGQPLWQRNYYERIIRNDEELNAIRQYIRDNPAKWADDPNNPANLRDA